MSRSRRTRWGRTRSGRTRWGGRDSGAVGAVGAGRSEGRGTPASPASQRPIATLTSSPQPSALIRSRASAKSVSPSTTPSPGSVTAVSEPPVLEPAVLATGPAASHAVRARKSASLAQDLRMPSVQSTRENWRSWSSRGHTQERNQPPRSAPSWQRLAVASPAPGAAGSWLSSSAAPAGSTRTRSQSPRPATAHQRGVSSSIPRVEP